MNRARRSVTQMRVMQLGGRLRAGARLRAPMAGQPDVQTV